MRLDSLEVGCARAFKAIFGASFRRRAVSFPLEHIRQRCQLAGIKAGESCVDGNCGDGALCRQACDVVPPVGDSSLQLSLDPPGESPIPIRMIGIDILRKAGECLLLHEIGQWTPERKTSHDGAHARSHSSRSLMLSLREILDWEILSGHTVIAGASSLSVDVQSITVIDAPDAVNWVKPHEFVVTSTYPVQQGPDVLVALIEQLAARNAAGLGVKLTRYLREFPDNARRRADELGFPIISLPGPLPWSDLLGRVFAHDGRQQGREAAYLSAIYRAFSQHRTGIGSLRELFDLVAGFVNLPVVLALENEAGLQLESRGVTEAEAEMLAEMLIDGAATGAQPDDMPLRVTVGGEKVAVARSGMGVNGGGLVAVVEREQSASEPDLECLRLSVHLLQTLVDANAGPRANLASNAKLLGDLLDPLLSREAKNVLIGKALPQGNAWHTVVARIFDAGTLDGALLALRLRQFSRRHKALLREEDDGSEYVVAVPAPGLAPLSSEAVLRELHQIFERQLARAQGFRYGLGQSGPAALSEAASLRHEATQAMMFGVSLNGFNRMSRHEDVMLLRLLTHPSVIAESRPGFLRLLEPLLAMGEQGTPLIETLKIWLREDESMARTAELLGLHVNTVRQRLERCRTILGLTDFRTDTRLRLYVALQLLPLLTNAEG
ncbi:hypothetical protein CHELA1G11_13912 [Hyphomicrobiales bacterium]|nr:Purine catabolism regulator [Hyphomicrobiales bacterium]CAH1674908.1 hypothetical protein CHELA1G11_13912 [Hyphomicrobiales bacterium]